MEHSTHHPGAVLPSEIHAYVLSFCDDPTLASSSRVSLAFLELTGPLLYRDITVRGKDQLDLLRDLAGCAVGRRSRFDS